jgi:hypothetical protein
MVMMASSRVVLTIRMRSPSPLFGFIKLVIILLAPYRLKHGAFVLSERIVDDGCAAAFIPIRGAPVRHVLPFNVFFNDFEYMEEKFQITVDVREFALIFLVLAIRMAGGNFVSDPMDFFIRTLMSSWRPRLLRIF